MSSPSSQDRKISRLKTLALNLVVSLPLKTSYFTAAALAFHNVTISPWWKKGSFTKQDASLNRGIAISFHSQCPPRFNVSFPLKNFVIDGFISCWKQTLWISHVVTDRTFVLAELFGRTSTVRFGPSDRTFFCRTQNFFHIAFNANVILSYFCFA